EVGQRWTIAESVARQFAPVLSPYADTRFRPRPDDLRSAEFAAEIEAADARTVRIRLTGRWRADWKHDNNEHSIGSATAEGVAVFDRSKNSLISLLMIFD